MTEHKSDQTPMLSEEAHAVWMASKEADAKLRLYRHLLKELDISYAIEFWLYEAHSRQLLATDTIRNYRNYLNDFLQRGIFSQNVGSEQRIIVSDLNRVHKTILYRLENCQDLTQNERRYRLTALIAFSKFLEEVTNGAIKKLEAPASWAISPVNKRPAPLVLSAGEFRRFGEELKLCSERDYVVISIIAFAARPLTEVLALRIDDLDFDHHRIKFRRKGGTHSEVTLDNGQMRLLKSYLEKSQGHRKDHILFVTKKGKPILRTHFTQLLCKISERADLGFSVSIKMLQWMHATQCHEDGWSAEQIKNHFGLERIPKHLTTNTRSR